jgi:hypothetical protein
MSRHRLTKDQEEAVMAADGVLNEAGALAGQIVKVITENLQPTPSNQLAVLTGLALVAAGVVELGTIPDAEGFFLRRFKMSLQRRRGTARRGNGRTIGARG